MSEPCTQCTPLDDGGCDFGCPCRDCEISRRHEAFVTNPYRTWPPSAKEAKRFLAELERQIPIEVRR
jgi:hypothetical protein